MTGQNNIYDTLTKQGQFSTLTKAIDAAGLADTFKGNGPYTMFAPTDAAFAKLPQNTLHELMQPAHKEQLTNLLKFHTVSGKLLAKDVKDRKAAQTLQGQELKLNAPDDDNFKVNDARIVTLGLEASNGVIHAIDTVLMPQAAAAAAR